MALEMELGYRLRWLDFDRYGRIQPVAILDLCQDIATLQAEAMGIGRDYMQERGVFWAAVRMKYEITRQPRLHDVVTVRTWPHSPSNFSFMRDFQLRDDRGDLLAVASTEWVLMSAEERKLVRMRDHYQATDDYSDDRVFEKKLRKLAGFGEGNRPAVTMTPAFSDIDLNGHVNNARYLRLVADALELEPGRAIASMQIDYRHELPPGAPFEVHILDEGALLSAKGVRNDGETAFVCTLGLEPTAAS